MFISTILDVLSKQSNELKNCYGSLSHYHNISNSHLKEAIEILDHAIIEIHEHPKTLEELTGERACRFCGKTIKVEDKVCEYCEKDNRG